MAITDQITLTFHKNTFFEVQTPSHTIFIDPVFSRRRRGRRVADELRSCDYLFATSMTPWFDDVLDVLDEFDATLVASPRLTRFVSNELGLRRGRLLDLEPWERASEEGWRVTAFPITASIGMEKSIAEGASILRDMGNILPDTGRRARIPLADAARPIIDLGVRSLSQVMGSITNLGRTQSASRVGEMFNLDLGQITGGRPGMGYLFEFEGYATLMHLADGVHSGTIDEDLEDIADVAEPDVLMLHLGGRDVDPYVRAVRVLRPSVLYLYRSRDPYAEGRRGHSLPLSTFVGAIREGAPQCEIKFLRKGDAFSLDKAKSAPSTSAQPGAKPAVSKLSSPSATKTTPTSTK